MKQAIGYNETTSTMGGARPTDLSKEDILAIALLDYRKNLPVPDNDAPKIDWVELGKNVNNSSVGIPIAVKPTSEAVKQQNLLGGGRTLTTEDKFYEMIGIKKTDGTGWGLQSRPVGRLLVAVVLIGGYFAYKKFKK